MATNRYDQFDIHVSPDAGDIVFYELRDADLAINKTYAYGDAHPNATRFPGYRLVYISETDQNNQQRWFYAKDWNEQEAHNWRVSYPYAGIKTAPRFECVFIVRRDEYVPLDLGDAHPLDEGADTPEHHQQFIGAVLVSQRQVNIGFQQIESLYIAIRRVYDKVPSPAEQLTYNIETTFPHGGLKEYPRRTRTLIFPRQDFSPVTKGTADPIFTSAKLIDEAQLEIGDEEIRSLYVAVRRTYDEPPTIAAQEAYNAEIEYPYYGDTRFPRTVRSYMVPRADLAAAVIPSAGLALGGATLAYRKVDRIAGQAEDSFYVVVTVAHDRVPLASDLTPGGEYDFLKGFGYTVSRPYGTDDHPRVTWRVPGVKSGFALTPEYTACPITGFTTLLLTDEQFEADQSNASVVNVVRVYDSLPGPELESTETEKFASVPEGFIATRTVESITQPVKNDAAIDTLNGDAPTVGGGALVSARLGAARGNTVVWEKGSNRVSLTLGSLTGVEFDQETGRVSDVTQEIVAAGTAGSGVNASGEFSEVRPLNQYFSIKTTRKATTLGSGGNGLSYETVINYAWPPVLEAGGLTFFAVEHKDGHLLRYGWDIQLKEGYSGPCKAVVTEQWFASAQTAPTITQMQPTAIWFDFPMTRVFSIPACLHPLVMLQETVGSNHPTLHPTVTTKSFAATNYTNWPASILADFSQRPYRGGFKTVATVVHSPA